MNELENFMDDLHLAYDWKDGTEDVNFFDRLYALTVLEKNSELARKKISDYSKRIKELEEENTVLLDEIANLEHILAVNDINYTNLVCYSSQVEKDGIQEVF